MAKNKVVILNTTVNKKLVLRLITMNLRRGKKRLEHNSSFFIGAKDNQVHAMDPETGLYSFMMAAVGNKSDLTAVYYLLSRNRN